MTDCKYLRPNKVCTKLSDREVSQPCVESPCEYEKPMTGTEKDIAAIDIGIQAIERNKAAITECNVCIGGLSKLTGFRGEEAAFLQGQINAYKNTLKILEGDE